MTVHGQVKVDDTRGEPYLSSAEIIERLAKLGPLIEEEADEIDRQRHLTPRILEALREAGAFRIAWPAVWGGPEMRLDDQIKAVELLSYHDASVAWNVQILSDTGFYAGQFPKEVAYQLCSSMDNATAGGFYPPARADRVEGGWHVAKGQWPFGSGIHSADCIVCGINLHENGELLRDKEGEPEFRVAYLPKDKVAILDTWYTLGLRGSGSTDYAVTDIVIPDGHVFPAFSETLDKPHLPPLSRHVPLVAVSLQGVIVGLGRRILDDVQAALKKRSPNDRMARVQYAEAEMNYRAARSYCYDVARRLSDQIERGETPTRAQYTEANLSAVNAGQQITRSAMLGMELLGASVIYNRSPFERRRRDLETLLVHISHQRRALEVPGGVLLGEGNLPRLA